jgi:hypothetical protein
MNLIKTLTDQQNIVAKGEKAGVKIHGGQGGGNCVHEHHFHAAESRHRRRELRSVAAARNSRAFRRAGGNSSRAWAGTSTRPSSPRESKTSSSPSSRSSGGTNRLCRTLVKTNCSSSSSSIGSHCCFQVFRLQDWPRCRCHSSGWRAVHDQQPRMVRKIVFLGIDLNLF